MTKAFIISLSLVLISNAEFHMTSKVPEVKHRENKIFDYECILEKKEYLPQRHISKTHFHNSRITFKYDEEQFLTYWDCGEYGKLMCNYKKVFIYAQKKSMLTLFDNGIVVRIIGIK